MGGDQQSSVMCQGSCGLQLVIVRGGVLVARRAAHGVFMSAAAHLSSWHTLVLGRTGLLAHRCKHAGVVVWCAPVALTWPPFFSSHLMSSFCADVASSASLLLLVLLP